MAAAYIFISEYTQTKFFFLKQWMCVSQISSRKTEGGLGMERAKYSGQHLINIVYIVFFIFSLFVQESWIARGIVEFFFIPDGLDEISR